MAASTLRSDPGARIVVRSGLLWLSRRQALFRLAQRNGLARAFARRFVAGETLEDALAAVHAVNTRGLTASLDLLGESVQNVAEAQRARDQIIAVLQSIAATGVRSNVSVKLTQLGLDVDAAAGAANIAAILHHALGPGVFVRIDMEGSAYTDRTLALFSGELHPRFGDRVGVVLQSCLRRSENDLARLLAHGARIRLVKGAYAEPADLAYRDKRDVDRAFARMTERMLDVGSYPAIATHDERLIAHAVDYAERRRIGKERFEFQMLYGVRRDLQERLHRDGYAVRVYIPFGTQWYPYLMRRLAERPANVAFIVGSVIKEGLSRR